MGERKRRVCRSRGRFFSLRTARCRAPPLSLLLLCRPFFILVLPVGGAAGPCSQERETYRMAVGTAARPSYGKDMLLVSDAFQFVCVVIWKVRSLAGPSTVTRKEGRKEASNLRTRRARAQRGGGKGGGGEEAG